MENKKLNRRTQIIEDAIKVLVEGGYSNASIGNIAKKGGISKGVVTYHFPNKEELMKAVVEYSYALAVPYMGKSMEGLDSAPAFLRGYIESNLRFMFEHRKYVMAIIEVVSNARTENGELLYKNEDESIYEPLIEIFKWGQEIEGSFREFSPLIMAKTIRSVIDSIGPRIAKEDVSDMEKLIAEITDTFDFATRKNI
ncbi:TetR/AcrR family transcriptional regulator [Bacillus cereus group sp. Bc002]|uniref:TetR/AcrR family transcriptional regulator n=1 Tax=Bacillus pretiosus TaxID=2983392 RepID=A0ABT3ET41_9BACI|nr:MULTISPECIES: TetR/AcrR family transcriptional regulator [Bacillus]ASI77750.1 TetR family transcriptional regulator [Bacillus cereus]KXI55707.1 TetR family transcriptional regulator [Bacillus cereus]MCC2391489.1 TetR/AcrR family transcriptional regulator [Bacillus pacificus]MCC2417043.1 TetR/AcrR family transcriptional regulator [Bacillus pacificus]MCC2474104.1 TetR/AcrR family transcriptional regulator [Bacillus pacificus]